MTKKTLIEALRDVPDDILIVMSKDAEGNGYSPLDSISGVGTYVPETTWYGQFFFRGEEIEEGDEGQASQPAICLAPVN